MTKSRISLSRPLLYLDALVSKICLAMAGSDTTTKDFGPNDRRKMGPYAKKSLYNGTNTGSPTISRMSPRASGMRSAAAVRH